MSRTQIYKAATQPVCLSHRYIRLQHSQAKAAILDQHLYFFWSQNCPKRAPRALGCPGGPWGPYFPLFFRYFLPSPPPLGAPYFSFYTAVISPPISPLKAAALGVGGRGEAFKFAAAAYRCRLPACQIKVAIRSKLSARSMLDLCPDLCYRSLPRSVQDSDLSP